MNCSTPGFPVHHQLPESTQTHVHRVSDAIQPSHPLSSPFPPVPIPLSIRFFSNESTLCMRWPKYWSFSFSISPSIGWLKKLRAINSICNYTWVNIFQYKVKKFFFGVHICKISLHFLTQSFPQLSQNDTCFF